MPNTFLTLDVPKVANGTGTPTIVASTGHPKSVVASGLITGRYVLEGSNDGGQTWDILKDDNDGTEALFTASNSGVKSVDCVIEQVRVRSFRALDTASPPTITFGAPPALGRNFFSTLDVPATPGLGAILDLGMGAGPLKTFILRGAVPERGRFTMLASMDGIRFDEVLLFTADQQGARSERFMCRFVRVHRSGAAGVPPKIALGCEPAAESSGGGDGGGSPGEQGPFVTMTEPSAKTTSSLGSEEVIGEFVMPGTNLSAGANAAVMSFAALARMDAPEGQGSAVIRLRHGGQLKTPDGDVIASANVSGVIETRYSGRSSTMNIAQGELVKFTAQGNAAARPVVRGLVVYLEPASKGVVVG